MNTKSYNKLATPQKKLSLPAYGVLALTTAFLLSIGVNKLNAEVIDSVTEDIRTSSGREYSTSKGGSACNQLENVTTSMGSGSRIHPVRSGRQAFKHWVDRCGERSELKMKTTVIGDTYWYGWSMFIPSDWEDTPDGYDIVNQWATYPTSKNFRTGCGANGSYLIRNGDSLTFKFQRQGDTTQIVCTGYNLAKVSDVRGKWVDFVMHTKWTGNTDGFLKFWMKIGNRSYSQKVNYTGRTYWNDEGTGPYFKTGLYKGEPNFNGPAPRYLYTDEYRLGNANSSFAEVAPPDIGEEKPGRTQSLRVEAENMFLSAYRIEENSAASNGQLISLNNATQPTDTASSTFPSASGKYDVYLAYFDENDGVADLKVTVGGVRLAAPQLDQNLGANYANTKTLVRKKLKSGLSINKGAEIEIEGTVNQEEWARVDYIDFVPVP